jgi:hypothetical protein
MATKTSLNGYLLVLKSALCAVKIPAEYDTIAAQTCWWLQGDVEELQIRKGCSWRRQFVISPLS